MPFLSAKEVLQTIVKYDEHLKIECTCEYCNTISALSNYLSTHKGNLPRDMYSYYNFDTLSHRAQKYLMENEKNYL